MDFPYSEDEMRSRLGISTLAVKLSADEMLAPQHLRLIAGEGIGKLELSGGYDPRNKQQLKQLASQAADQGLEIVSLHGPAGKFSSAYSDGIREEERRSAMEAAVIQGEAALELGASVLVCHFGTTESSAESVLELLDYFKGTPLVLGGENVGKAVSSLQDSDDVADFVSFSERIGCERFGLVLDLGHARDKAGANPFFQASHAYDTVAQCKDWLVHVHLHDGTEERADDHYPPFDGDVQWLDVFLALHEIDYQGCFMFEPVFEGYSAFHCNPDVIKKVGAFPRHLISCADRRMP